MSLESTLFADDEHNIYVLDIPSSLSAPRGFVRYSQTAPQEPYSLPEPQSRSAFDEDMVKQHEMLKQKIDLALKTVQSLYHGAYCNTRSISEESTDLYLDLRLYTQNLRMLLTFNDAREKVDLTVETSQSIEDIYGVPCVNRTNQWINLHLKLEKQITFKIPPSSSFLLGQFNDTRKIFEQFSREHQNPGFDLFLMDPPWQNKSVRRAHHSYSYTTSQFDMYDLFKLNLKCVKDGGHLRENGIVAVWITNKSKYRRFVVEKLFPSWNLKLLTEWVWIKMTEKGEPVYDLESISRKPYEVLLLASSGKRTDLVIPDKVIFAVPEYHSRKPCIKGLIDRYLRLKDDMAQINDEPPRICEMFGRNLTEGWLTWGDEVLKGNSEGCWKNYQQSVQDDV